MTRELSRKQLRERYRRDSQAAWREAVKRAETAILCLDCGKLGHFTCDGSRKAIKAEIEHFRAQRERLGLKRGR